MKKSIPAFDIKLRNPVTRHVVTGFLFIGAFVCCWANELVVYVQLGLTACVFLLLWNWYRSAAYCHRGLQHIACHHDGYWLLKDIAGNDKLATLLDSSAVIGPLYFLNFTTLDGELSLLLTNDSMADSAARKLRATLNVYRQQLISVRL